MRTVIAAYCLCNTASINIYGIEYGIEDKVLAGINDQEPVWCPMDPYKNTFRFQGIDIPLSECMGV